MKISVDSIEGFINNDHKYKANPKVNIYFVTMILYEDPNQKLWIDKEQLQALTNNFPDWSKVVLIVDPTTISKLDLQPLSEELRIVSWNQSRIIDGHNFMFADDFATIQQLLKPNLKNVLFNFENDIDLQDIPLFAVILIQLEQNNWKITDNPPFICTKGDAVTGFSYLALGDSVESKQA